MNLKYIYTRLHVQNYLDCKLFYQDVLGLKVSLVNDAQEYAEIDVGATKITILNRARLKDYVDSIESVTYDRDDVKIIMTFAVPDLDEAIVQLKAKGVEIFSSPWQFSDDGLMGGLLSAGIRDPDGNIIFLGRGSANELQQILG